MAYLDAHESVYFDKPVTDIFDEDQKKHKAILHLKYSLLLVKGYR